jgi:lipoprotein-anchoring transpeptidase ErfK/SrfK
MTRSAPSARLAGLALALVAGALVAPGVGSASTVPTSKVAAVTASQEVVTLLGPHRARSRPTIGSPSRGLVPARTPITDVPTVLPVIGTSGRWLLVRLPGRPNGHTGWIDRSATSLSRIPWHVVVDLARRSVTVYDAGRVVRVFTAVVGKPSTPTPTGQFYVEESVALPSSNDAAPYALALSARSTVYRTFDGGPGQIALHGLSNVGGTPGTAASHGCVRLESATMGWLVRRIGPGVPVTIVA